MRLGAVGCRRTGSELAHRKYQFGWPAHCPSSGARRSKGSVIPFPTSSSMMIRL